MVRERCYSLISATVFVLVILGQEQSAVGAMVHSTIVHFYFKFEHLNSIKYIRKEEEEEEFFSLNIETFSFS